MASTLKESGLSSPTRDTERCCLDEIKHHLRVHGDVDAFEYK